ncbi:MAG: flavodoxin [Bacteroidales bacterium]|nr:flavodoxin [Bacteroidales bacterium]
MKTAIIYMSKHGSTEKMVEMLKVRLINSDIDVINLKKQKSPDISKYENIIIGGSIHVGKIQNRITKLIEKNINILLNKKVALFLCCMYENEKRIEQFNNSFPENLRNHSSANGLFGGEFVFEKMNFLERAIVKKVSEYSCTVSKIDEKAIDEFVEKFQK